MFNRVPMKVIHVVSKVKVVAYLADGKGWRGGRSKTHAFCSRRLMRTEVDGQTPSLLISRRGNTGC